VTIKGNITEKFSETVQHPTAQLTLVKYTKLRYDTCSKKLSLPHGINKKIKCETKNKK